MDFIKFKNFIFEGIIGIITFIPIRATRGLYIFITTFVMAILARTTEEFYKDVKKNLSASYNKSHFLTISTIVSTLLYVLLFVYEYTTLETVFYYEDRIAILVITIIGCIVDYIGHSYHVR